MATEYTQKVCGRWGYTGNTDYCDDRFVGCFTVNIPESEIDENGFVTDLTLEYYTKHPIPANPRPTKVNPNDL